MRKRQAGADRSNRRWKHIDDGYTKRNVCLFLLHDLERRWMKRHEYDLILVCIKRMLQRMRPYVCVCVFRSTYLTAGHRGCVLYDFDNRSTDWCQYLTAIPEPCHLLSRDGFDVILRALCRHVFWAGLLLCSCRAPQELEKSEPRPEPASDIHIQRHCINIYVYIDRLRDASGWTHR